MIKAMTLTIALLLLSTQAEAKHRHSHRYITIQSDFGEQILPHPTGCPRIAFCGCGARVDLGLTDPRLNLAWNWITLYHGSTLVAVWRHHVAIIERMTGPMQAILRDYNSGGHLSRRHERSIAGARIVGAAYASVKDTLY